MAMWALVVFLGAAHDERRENVDFALFWGSELQETDEIAVPMDGRLPAWLDGTVYRNGPGRFEFGDRRVSHQFDGFAKLYKFRLDGASNRAFYATKFIKSKSYNMSLAANDVMLKMTMYPLVPPLGEMEMVERMEHASGDNCLINIWNTGDHLYATADQPLPCEFDPVNLDFTGYGPPIKGADPEKDAAAGKASAAHPARPKGTESTVNYLASPNILTGNTQVHVYEDTPDMQRRWIGSTDLPYLPIMHSFPVTENYVILVVAPLHIQPMDMMKGKTNGAAAMHWHPDDPTILVVFDRRQTNAKPVGVFHTTAFYANHQVNAWESGTAIHIDLLAFSDASFLAAREVFASLDLMRDMHRFKDWMVSNTTHTRPRLSHIKIDLASKEVTKQDQVIIDTRTGAELACEMPRINDLYNGREYCVFYGVCSHVNASLDVGLYVDVTKINVCKGTGEMLHKPSDFSDEPIFIPQPGAAAEDAGVLVFPVLDGYAGKTQLRVVDATTLRDVALVHAPFHHPSGVHGRFFESKPRSVLV